MRSNPWESTPATSPRPRTGRMSSGACGRPSRRHSETASACGTSPKAEPRTNTHPHHPTSVGAPTPAAPTAPQEPCTRHNTTRLTPRPAAPPPNPVTQQTTTTGRDARPRPEVTKVNRTPKDANAHDDGHHYAQRHRAQARYRRNRLTEPKPTHKSNPSHTPKPLTLESQPGPPREQRNHSPHPQPTQPPNQPAPEAKRHLTKPNLTGADVHQDARAAPLGRDRRHSTDNTRQRTQHCCTAAPAARACACMVRAPLFFFFFKKTKKTKIRGGGRGTQPPMAHAHRTQRAHR